jgi:hypothetical protein
MIHSHLYARKSETPVFEDPFDNGSPVYILRQGNWMGVLQREGDWIQVIGIDCTGWVRSEDVEERPPFSLHALWVPGQPIEYVNTPQ